MRIGDVGTVSHIGDLLAFSLSVFLVMSLIYQVDIRNLDEDGLEQIDWRSAMISIRNWVGFDPDGDGMIDIDGIVDRVSLVEEPFPVNDEVHVSFQLEGKTLDLAFLDGSAVPGRINPLNNILVHGCSVLVIHEDSIFPCLMNVAISGGME